MLRKRLEDLIDGFQGRIGIYVKDLSTGKEWSIDPDGSYHPASTIKTCILWELFYQADKNNLNLDEKNNCKRRRYCKRIWDIKRT